MSRGLVFSLATQRWSCILANTAQFCYQHDRLLFYEYHMISESCQVPDMVKVGTVLRRKVCLQLPPVKPRRALGCVQTPTDSVQSTQNHPVPGLTLTGRLRIHKAPSSTTIQQSCIDPGAANQPIECAMIVPGSGYRAQYGSSCLHWREQLPLCDGPAHARNALSSVQAALTELEEQIHGPAGLSTRHAGDRVV